MSPFPKQLLVVPFLVPLLAVGWGALQERGVDTGLLPERAQGRLVRVAGSWRVVVLGMHTARALVFEKTGRLLGEVKPSSFVGTQALPFVDGDRIVFPVGRKGTPIEEVVVGQLPFGGGVSQAVRLGLPAPMSAQAPDGELQPQVPQLALSCADRLLLHTTRGWAQVFPSAGAVAPLVARPATGCRPIPPTRRRPELPIPTRAFAEVWIEGRPLALGAPHIPPAFVTALSPGRRRYHGVQPPAGAATRGHALVANNWVLFLGRLCRLRTLRLTLADSSLGKVRWTSERPMDLPPSCSQQQLPQAWICRGGVRLGLAGGELAFHLEDGTSVDPRGLKECQRMHPMRERVAAWEGARTLEQGDVLYRVEAGYALRATRGARQLWRHALPGPSWILGATARDLLVVAVPDLLLVFDRRTGTPRTRLRVPALHDPLEGRPSLTQWIGAASGRGYFLLVRSKPWLMRIQTTTLAIFDGERIKLVE